MGFFAQKLPKACPKSRLLPVVVLPIFLNSYGRLMCSVRRISFGDHPIPRFVGLSPHRADIHDIWL